MLTLSYLVQRKHIKTYFKIFHPLTIICWNSFLRACAQNIYTIYAIVCRKSNLQVRGIEISARIRLSQKIFKKSFSQNKHLKKEVKSFKIRKKLTNPQNTNTQKQTSLSITHRALFIKFLTAGLTRKLCNRLDDLLELN